MEIMSDGGRGQFQSTKMSACWTQAAAFSPEEISPPPPSGSSWGHSPTHVSHGGKEGWGAFGGTTKIFACRCPLSGGNRPAPQLAGSNKQIFISAQCGPRPLHAFQGDQYWYCPVGFISQPPSEADPFGVQGRPLPPTVGRHVPPPPHRGGPRRPRPQPPLRLGGAMDFGMSLHAKACGWGWGTRCGFLLIGVYWVFIGYYRILKNPQNPRNTESLKATIRAIKCQRCITVLQLHLPLKSFMPAIYIPLYV